MREHIRTEFGNKVLAIVEGCTDAEAIPKPPWRERKEKDVVHLAGASPSVLLVSASDKLYNARAVLQDFREIGDAAWTRFTGDKAGALWYYRALSDAFQTHASQQQGNAAKASYVADHFQTLDTSGYPWTSAPPSRPTSTLGGRHSTPSPTTPLATTSWRGPWRA